jgi:hypothetical protein
MNPRKVQPVASTVIYLITLDNGSWFEENKRVGG